MKMVEDFSLDCFLCVSVCVCVCACMRACVILCVLSSDLHRTSGMYILH